MTIRLWALTCVAILLGACSEDGLGVGLGDDDDDDDDGISDAGASDADADADADDAGGPQPGYPPTDAPIFLVYGYPAVIESASVDAYLAINSKASFNGEYWTYDDGVRYFTIRQYQDDEGFYEGLRTPGAIVVFAGHSNFCLGASFSPLEDHSEVDHISSVDDFWQYGTDAVAINYELLLTNQAYPNFVLDPEDVVQNPVNYTVPIMNVDRFPNTLGVEPGEEFTPYGDDGYGNPFHYVDTHDGYEKTIVRASALNLPEDLAYDLLFVRSCQSGRYYIHNLDRGTMFYTDGEAEYDSAMVYRFIKGIFEGNSYDEILEELNSVDPIYYYHSFDETR